MGMCQSKNKDKMNKQSQYKCTVSELLMNSSQRYNHNELPPHMQENLAILNQCSIFDCISEKHKQQIAIMLTEAQVQKDQCLIHEGQRAYSIIIIKSGTVSCKKNHVERYSEINEVFCKRALIPESLCDETLIAKTDVIALLIYNSLLNELLNGNTEILLYQSVIKNTLLHDHFTKKIDKLMLNEVICQFQIIHYDNLGVVIPKYTKWQFYYIVLEGEINYFRLDGRRSNVQKGQSMGKYQIMYEKTNEIVLEDVIIQGPGIVAKISSEILKNAQNIDLKGSARLNLETLQNYENEDENLKIFDLIYLKDIMQTDLSRIMLVKLPENEKLFTIQMFPKKIIVQKKQEKRLKNFKHYKTFLLENHQSRLPQLIRTYSIQDYIIFLNQMKYVIPFQIVLKQLGLLNKADAVYYTTQMVYILENIHLNSYIHRNFTPEIMAVDYKGRLQLLDCFSCKKLLKGRTSSFIGTPHYMAPEVLSRTNHYGYAVDLWSLGICLYELLCGIVPFGEKETDPIKIFEEIQEDGEINFPFFLSDKPSKDLICRLLSKDPQERLGGNYDNLKAHPFFDSVDWDHLHNLHPPYIPTVKEDFKKEIPELGQKNIKISSFRQADHHYVSEGQLSDWDYEYF